MTTTTPTPTGASREQTSTVALLAALTVIVALRFTYYGRLALYPLTLFATWVHEMGHGLSAIAIGGHFSRLEIFANAAGMAHSSYPTGLASALVSLGGLLAPPLVGCAIIVLARSPRMGRVLLWLLALAMLVSLVIWVRTLVGALLLVPLAFGLVLVARKLSRGTGLFVVQLLGFSLALDTVSRLDYLFVDRVTIDGRTLTSDIGKVADVLGGPTLMWGLLVAGVALGLVAIAGWVALRRITA